MDNAFITGSRAYGVPRFDSDLDVVLLIEDADTRGHFIQHADSILGQSAGDQNDLATLSVKCGTVNFIICKSKEQFDLWKRGTDDLLKNRPVLRQQAIEYFNALREKAFSSALS